MVDIRRARKEDIPGIRAVLAATWRDTYSTFLTDVSMDQVTAQWHSPEVLEAEIARPSTYSGVATTPSAGIVGMITAHARGALLFVARMYVLPEFQRRGIGERMMTDACGAFPDSERILLEVGEQNQKGRAFYRKVGFREVRTREEDLAGSRLSLVVMEKSLSGSG